MRKIKNRDFHTSLYYLAGVFVGLSIAILSVTLSVTFMLLAAIAVIVGFRVEDMEEKANKKTIVVDLLSDNFTRVMIDGEFIVGGTDLDLDKTKYLIRKLGYDVNTKNDDQE